MSPQAPGQEGRGRGGEGCGGGPRAPDPRPPQPHLDVQERIRDVQPGVQVRDVIRTRCLKGSNLFDGKLENYKGSDVVI